MPGARALPRAGRRRAAPACAFHLVPVMRDGVAAGLGQVGDLMGDRTPRSAAPDRSAPHPHLPCGKCGIVPSGSSFHARKLPGAPGCLPGLRLPPRCGLVFGGFFPGWSSIDGGIEEFWLLRDISRSSRAIFASRSAIFASLSSFNTRSRSTCSRSLPSRRENRSIAGRTGRLRRSARRHDTKSRP